MVWDLHLYHDFSDAWALLSHARHAAVPPRAPPRAGPPGPRALLGTGGRPRAEVVEENARVLASRPGAVVGEWSLARPSGSAGSGYSEEEVADFATRQVALSMGMGVPLLALGASAGQLLPRAGAWMQMRPLLPPLCAALAGRVV